MDTGTIIGIIVGVGATVANIVLAVVAIWSLRDNHKQVREARQEAIESQQNLHRPILVILYRGPAATNLPINNGQLLHNQTPLYISYKNIGSGMATNIQGWVYGFIPEDHSTGVTTRYQLAAPEPSPPDWEQMNEARANLVQCSRKEQIGGHPLAAPEGMAARVILTYHDIFGNKHAAIWDLSSDKHWISRGFPRITKDIADLDQEKGRQIAQAMQARLDAVQHRAIQAPLP